MNIHQKRRPINSSKPKVLKARDLPSLAQYILSKDCKNVMLMVGDLSRPQLAFSRLIAITSPARCRCAVCLIQFTWRTRLIWLLLHSGVSTSAGIPDFRSPETGMFNLKLFFSTPGLHGRINLLTNAYLHLSRIQVYMCVSHSNRKDFTGVIL